MVIFAAWTIPDIINILYVALGLGLVIFIHELGHFAVAKWCGVKVERFSIGFGPVIWKYTRGETEYALSLIPFGGYVKMLGQDDADPSQLTDTNIARDPRSYTSKSVPQRIAIISAGVINNMVSAVLFFIIAFMFGVQYQPAVIGQVVPGMPAWQGGLRLGDRLTKVAGREDQKLRFVDVRQAVALSNGPIEIEGLRDGKPFRVTVDPEIAGQMFPTIGVEGESGLTLRDIPQEKDASPTTPGSAAAAAKPPFKPGDEIRKVDDVEIESFAHLQNTLAAKRDKTVEISVRRKGDAADKLQAISVGPNRFHTLGLRMDIGKIASIQNDSPAAMSKQLKVGDKITHVIVDGQVRPVGIDLDPLQLPDYFASLAGKQVTLRVKREVPGGDPVTEDVTLVPEDRPGWVERPGGRPDCPLSAPAIGIAYHVLHHVLKVEPGSAAEGKIKENDNIQKLEFLLPESERGEPILFGEADRNWAMAFWIMQTVAQHKVKLTVISQGDKEPHDVELLPQVNPEWYLPMRGFAMQPLSLIRKADSIGEAALLGFHHTRDSVIDMYMTIKSLIPKALGGTGRISPKALGGPIRIFQAAYFFSERGVPDLILFLGMLSVSLAVLNFLPIPVLDGGHFVFLCWEGIRGKPPSEKVVITANYIGLALVLSLMVWVIYMDISSLFGR